MIPDEINRRKAEQQDAKNARASVTAARQECERLRALVLQLADEIEGEGHRVWAREIRAVAGS